MTDSFLNFKSEASISPVLRAPIFTSFTISAIIFIVTIIYYVYAQPQLPLFYSLARPVERLVPKIWLFILPSTSLFMSILHTFLVQLFREYNQVILRLFIWITVIFQVILLLIFLRIVLITI